MKVKSAITTDVLTVGTVVPVAFLASPAQAATPGSACTVRVNTDTLLSFPGTVNSGRETCVPNGVLGKIILFVMSFAFDAQCGPSGRLPAYADCPE